MKFRTDIEDFPFSSKDRGIWYFIIDWENKTEVVYSLVQEKKDLVAFLAKLINENNSDLYELLGVWNGQYRTDIFKIPIRKGYEKLSEVFN